ncbi:hypothetical protein FVE85_5634 [Porphyridium purpureum]|uniref:Uncharacterized protein n=1 Tax=Porphyridium purpureum TaxID=35688 RepID=A0A5J4Z284_PORPP|nr:hypothetical protein FVE85_5634 [Porphyridium purpureum]|eukprot:POR6850..scf295_1
MRDLLTASTPRSTDQVYTSWGVFGVHCSVFEAGVQRAIDRDRHSARFGGGVCVCVCVCVCAACVLGAGGWRSKEERQQVGRVHDGCAGIRVHAASACRSGTRRPWRRGSGPRVHARRRGICYASQGGAPEPEGAPGSQTSLAEKLILAASAVALPAVIASELHLFQTGCGLPPGPGGLYGAAEGVGFLVMLGVVAYSAYTKFKTGKGLPAGPYGLVGAAEGIWYLLLFIFLADYAYLYFTNSLPGAICYEQQ